MHILNYLNQQHVTNDQGHMKHVFKKFISMTK